MLVLVFHITDGVTSAIISGECVRYGGRVKCWQEDEFYCLE